jgi:hypothetical protein
LDASIQLNPIVPGVVSHDDVERTIAMLSVAGANHVIVKFVEAGYSWAPELIRKLCRLFGKVRGGSFAALFSENMGGQRCIAEAYRIEGHLRYSRAAKAAGLTYATCHEYAYERSARGEIVSKVGLSIARQFTTAAQCHGQRVPMFTRRTLAQQFSEVKECPPTGCLYCEDDNGGEPRCGSRLYGAAKALRITDLKQGVYDR